VKRGVGILQPLPETTNNIHTIADHFSHQYMNSQFTIRFRLVFSK
jgi:hypothetical protein